MKGQQVQRKTRPRYTESIDVEDSIEVEVGPVKVQSDGYATYILIAVIFILGLAFIYGKFIHHRVVKRRRR